MQGFGGHVTLATAGVRWPPIQFCRAESPNYFEPGKMGNQSALEHLTPIVYKELHRLARRHMSRENESQTLQTTELIHEAYLRLVGSRACDGRIAPTSLPSVPS